MRKIYIKDLVNALKIAPVVEEGLQSFDDGSCRLLSVRMLGFTVRAYAYTSSKAGFLDSAAVDPYPDYVLPDNINVVDMYDDTMTEEEVKNALHEVVLALTA